VSQAPCDRPIPAFSWRAPHSYCRTFWATCRVPIAELSLCLQPGRRRPDRCRHSVVPNRRYPAVARSEGASAAGAGKDRSTDICALVCQMTTIRCSTSDGGLGLVERNVGW
jgi:hypothetical protein